MKNLFLIAALALATASSQELIPPQEAPTQISALNVVRIVEGVMYGVLHDAVPEGSLDLCIANGQQIESTIIDAVANLKKGTFDGIKTGLNQIGQAVKAMPEMLKTCSSVQKDLTILAKMAEIFSHPFSLIWQVGKSLIVNGSDIFDKISKAITAYQNGEYFEFGKNIGFALTEVFFKTSAISGQSVLKSTIDEQAYDFVNGFITSIEGANFDNQALYNEIDGKGGFVIGPVKQAMESLSRSEGTLNQKVWIKLHEVEHIFMEGGDFLISSGIVAAESLNIIRGRFECIDEENINETNRAYVEAHIANTLQYFEERNYFMVGHYLGFFGLLLCNNQSPQVYA